MYLLYLDSLYIQCWDYKCPGFTAGFATSATDKNDTKNLTKMFAYFRRLRIKVWLVSDIWFNLTVFMILIWVFLWSSKLGAGYQYPFQDESASEYMDSSFSSKGLHAFLVNMAKSNF